MLAHLKKYRETGRCCRQTTDSSASKVVWKKTQLSKIEQAGRENAPTKVIIGLTPQVFNSRLVPHLDYHCLCYLGICMLRSQQARENTPTPELNISWSKGPLLLDWVSQDEIKLTCLIENYNWALLAFSGARKWDFERPNPKTETTFSCQHPL